MRSFRADSGSTCFPVSWAHLAQTNKVCPWFDLWQFFWVHGWLFLRKVFWIYIFQKTKKRLQESNYLRISLLLDTDMDLIRHWLRRCGELKSTWLEGAIFVRELSERRYPRRLMVGIQVSFWDGLFLGALLVSGRVKLMSFFNLGTFWKCSRFLLGSGQYDKIYKICYIHMMQ